MKRLFCFLAIWSFGVLFVPASAQSKQQTLLHLTDSSGQMIRGTSTQRGYEKQIVATNFSGYTTGNAQVQFSMPAGGASATLATLQGIKKKLPFATFTITEQGENGLNVLYIIRLEEIGVIRTEDVNGITRATLQAVRIGTTYFQYDRKTGVRTESGKSGFDFGKSKPWSPL